MKKVLVLAGSPRKGGNSDLICDQLIKGIKEVGHAVEKIYIGEQKIGYCNACYACEKTGVCIQDDDMPDILEKMIAASAIVLATPVYYYTISAQLKTLIDRTFSKYYAKEKISNKEFYFIITAAEERDMMARVVDALTGFTDCLPNAKIKGVLYGENVLQKGEVKEKAVMQEAYEMGKSV